MLSYVNRSNPKLKELNMKKVISLVLVCFVMSCTPEVGSEKWCKMMDEKPKGEWTANEASDYTKHCVFN